MYFDPQFSPSTHRPTAERRAERHTVELLARYAWKGLRGTVMLKDLTLHGARIEGLEALRKGDGLTLLMPDLPPVEATVAWAIGRAAGLQFEQPLEEEGLARMVRDFGPGEGLGLSPASLPRPAELPRRLCA